LVSSSQIGLRIPCAAATTKLVVGFAVVVDLATEVLEVFPNFPPLLYFVWVKNFPSWHHCVLSVIRTTCPVGFVFFLSIPVVVGDGWSAFFLVRPLPCFVAAVSNLNFK
jgi:hypothetical protein